MARMLITKSRSKFRYAACLLAVLLVTCVPALAEGEELTNDAVSESVENVGTGDTIYYVPDYPDYWIAHVEAPEGGADLNAICACIMLGSGAVCGILAGSELVKRWNI